MEPDDLKLLNAKPGELLSRALVTVRKATNAPTPGEPDRMTELNDWADFVHNTPRFIVGHDQHAIDPLKRFRGAMFARVRRFFPNIDSAAHA